MTAARSTERAGSSGASLQPVLELRSRGTRLGCKVGRMRGTARRHEGDADDVEWRDERWTEGRDEGDVLEAERGPGMVRQRGKEGKAAAVQRSRERERVATGFQWSFAPDSPRALLKRNYGGKSCRTHANHDRERRRGRRRGGVA